MKEEIQKISINKTESKSGTDSSPTTSYYLAVSNIMLTNFNLQRAVLTFVFT